METLHLAIVDKFLILIYLILILFVGLFYSRHQRDTADNYLLAGRRLSLPAFTATLVATWYGGILGIGEFTYLYGILNWFTQALPYYLFAILFAYFIAPRVRKSNLYTIPDQFYEHYGKPAGLVGSVFIFMLVLPATHILMLGILFRAIFGIPFWFAILISIIFSTLYVLWGGLKSIVKTDIVQFILMFSGFVIMVISLYNRFGGLSFLRQNLPTQHLQLSGGQGVQYLIVWFFIALWTFVDPGFYQRCYAARTPQIARRGILISVLFWLIFDFLTTTAGLYARAIFQNVSGMMAFPLLGEKILAPVLSGLFFIALLATIMSTLDSNSFLAAVTFGRDMIWRTRKNIDINRATQLGLAVTLIFAVLLLWLVPSVVRIWYVLGTLCIPALLLPLIAVFYPPLRINPLTTLLSMMLSFLTTLTWLLSGIFRNGLATPAFPGKVQPFFIGITLSILIYSGEKIIIRWRKKKYSKE
jgi:SSS family solute:Na+ symporter